MLREPHDGAHSRELHAAVAARPPEQLPVPPSPQQPGRPQLQRPLPVSRVPLGPRRLHQHAVGWVNNSTDRFYMFLPASVSCSPNSYQHWAHIKHPPVANFPSYVPDMTNAATFRDLSKPVGALNKERLERLLVSICAFSLFNLRQKLNFCNLIFVMDKLVAECLLHIVHVHRLATEACPNLASCTAVTTHHQATSSSTWSESVRHTRRH